MPTSAPDNTVASLEVVMAALEPLIIAVAGQVEQAGLAMAEDTEAAHDNPESSARDTLIEALLICMIPICLLLLTAVTFLYRDPQVARSIALFVGTWYHEKKVEHGIVSSSPPPVRADPRAGDGPDDITIGGIPD